MTALYSRVCDRILGQIQSGVLRVGDRLPPEAEFAAELGVSRSTLRMAFAKLEASGVLQRRRRAGTRIISDAPQKRFSMVTTGINELLSLGRDTRFQVTGTRMVRKRDIPELSGQTGETGDWLEVFGARRLAGETIPFSVNRVYVPPRFAGIAPEITDAETSVFRAIEDKFDVSIGRVSQSLRAMACSPDDAAIMGLPSGAPVMQIEAQLFLLDGRLMEISVAKFDPDRFQVRTDVEIA